MFAPCTASSARRVQRSAMGQAILYPAPKGMRVTTIDQAAERFLATAGISDGTRRVYAGDLREFARWFGPDSPLEDVDIRVLVDWVSELGRARPAGLLAPAT